MRTGWALRLTTTKSADHTLAQDEAWLGTSRLSSNVTFDAGAATASFGLTQKWFWEDNRATLPGSELTATVAERRRVTSRARRTQTRPAADRTPERPSSSSAHGRARGMSSMS